MPTLSNFSVTLLLIHFFVKPVTDVEIIEMAKVMNKSFSSGHDNIPANIFLNSVPYIASVLTFLFNLSFTTGVFSDCYKIAKIIPIYKSGDSKLVNNYRPISSLPMASKLLEKLMHVRSQIILMPIFF